MKSLGSAYRRVFFTLIPLIAFTVTAAGLFWMVSDYRNYRNDTEEIRETILGYENDIVQHEIERLKHYIESEIQYYKENDSVSSESLQQKIQETISNIRYHEEGYVFILKTDRTILHSASTQDPTGGQTIDTILRTAREHPEGAYVDYLWPRLSSPELGHKTSYITFIPEWNWIIGAGYYHDDINQAIAERHKQVTARFLSRIWETFLFLLLASTLAMIFSRRSAHRLSADLESFVKDLETAVASDSSIPTEKLNLREFFHAAESINSILKTKQKAEKRVAESLREKETLLREVHHRTKNNLQIISSILSLQAPRIEVQQDKEIFEDCISRIHAMSLIHQHLYNSDMLSAIPVWQYTNNLISSLRTAFTSPGKTIDYEITIDSDIMFTIDKAIPFGLLLNETVSNSLKHAFTKQTEGLVTIALQQDEQKNTLSVCDTGRSDKSVLKKIQENKGSLGITLIYALAEQLNADVSVTVDTGVCWTFIFPIAN